MPSRNERGVSVGGLAAFAILLVVSVGLGGAVLTYAAAARQATTAADLAALAGVQAATQGTDPCAAATRIAGVNAARLERCVTSGQAVRVDVSVGVGLPVAGLPDRVTAHAVAAPTNERRS